MKYIGVKEAAKKWGISDRRVRILCEEGRIEGAIKLEWSWTIPQDSPKPFDGRTMRPFKNNSVRLGSIDILTLEKLRDENKDIDRLSDKMKALRVDNLTLALSLSHEKYDKKVIEHILSGKVYSSYSLEKHLLYSNFISLLTSIKKDNLPWDSKRVLELHRSYLQGIDDINSASFRDGFSDIKSLTGDSLKVVYQMETIFMQFEREWKSINEIFKAVLMFGQIMMIKPFESHNEDFALLLMLCMLESSGYILPSFDSDMCDEINAALTLALRRGSYQDLARIVERSLIKSYHTIHV
ncbi:MAG: hypothetical protein PUH25_00415 [Spirochaetales bacterium]|uniref:hypothetical protein n=1 Tax=Bullifex sp. TaxID=2815808 RepID=UPI002A586F9E|nr:hypothetical protein [Bullifex sp.]MDD5972868.1 hypothetical protein [Spirochaetales bacterium]MDD7270323.1 hypothetical protein [Spirochaetales bacterium]MDY4067073.1 hypothetical protein [Bullifex sp.]